MPLNDKPILWVTFQKARHLVTVEEKSKLERFYLEDTFLAWPILCFGLFTASLAFICEYCVGRKAQKNVDKKGRARKEQNKRQSNKIAVKGEKGQWSWMSS